MGVSGRIPGWKPKSAGQRISDHDRAEAIRALRVFRERGLIDEFEFEDRRFRVEQATTAREVEACFVDLRDGRRGRREARVTKDERDAALRRLALHREARQMSAAEYRHRVRIVRNATVHAEIEAELTELPPLRPRRQAPGERLVTDAERAAAEERLRKEHVAGRLTFEEYEKRSDVVADARTRNEIESAFFGLRSPTAAKRAETAGKVGWGLLRGSLLLVRTVLLLGWGAFVLAVAIAWQVTDSGPALPLIAIGVATILLRAMLRASAGRR